MPKNKAALALVKLRMKKTTPEQRSEAARIAGRASGIARGKKKKEREQNADRQ